MYSSCCEPFNKSSGSELTDVISSTAHVLISCTVKLMTIRPNYVYLFSIFNYSNSFISNLLWESQLYGAVFSLTLSWVLIWSEQVRKKITWQAKCRLQGCARLQRAHPTVTSPSHCDEPIQLWRAHPTVTSPSHCDELIPLWRAHPTVTSSSHCDEPIPM